MPPLTTDAVSAPLPAAPKQRDWLYWVLVVIAAMTVVSGVVQACDPAFILVPLEAQVTPTTEHFFGIVGMFMTLFGGMTLHALLGRRDVPTVVIWSALQKLSACAAVSLGVARDVFSALALLVAATDLVSGVLLLAYWRRIRV